MVPTARSSEAAHGVDPSLGIACDLSDPAAVRSMVEAVRPDAVFHLAGYAATSSRDHAMVHRANVGATENLIEALADTGMDPWLLAVSSGAVYGDTGPDSPAAESWALHANGAYASSKAAMEDRLRERAGRGVRVVVARAFNHTGPGQTEGFAASAFARQVVRIAMGLDEPVLRVGNLEAVRDFLDVRDVVRAYRLLAEAETVLGPWSVVNVASGRGRRMSDIVDSLADKAGVAVRVVVDPELYRPVDVAFSVGDPSLLHAATGFAPDVAWDRTLEDLLSDWRGRVGESIRSEGHGQKA